MTTNGTEDGTNGFIRGSKENSSLQARPGMRMYVRDHQLAAFFILAYALSWAAWSLAALSQESALGLAALYAGGFGPALSAAIITWYSGESLRKWAAAIVKWRVPARWYLTVLCLPVLLMIISGVFMSFLGIPIEPSLVLQRLHTASRQLQYIDRPPGPAAGIGPAGRNLLGSPAGDDRRQSGRGRWPRLPHAPSAGIQ